VAWGKAVSLASPLLQLWSDTAMFLHTQAVRATEIVAAMFSPHCACSLCIALVARQATQSAATYCAILRHHSIYQEQRETSFVGQRFVVGIRKLSSRNAARRQSYVP
jgi:hypothetical protein